MTKSYVTIEQSVCPVCGRATDTGNLLLHQKLRPVFNRTTCTHWELCASDKRKLDQGYIALIGCDPDKGGRTLADVYRTGAVAYVTEEIFKELFDMDVPEKGICFAEQAVLEQLKRLVPDGVADPDDVTVSESAD